MQPDGGSKGGMGRGRDGFGETTGQSSLKPAKPISFVLGRFYHGAVYHRLPKQCRCCSHCEPRPDLHPLRSSNTPPRWGWIDRHFRYLDIAIAIESKVNIPPFLILRFLSWSVTNARSSFVSRELYSKANLCRGDINNCEALKSQKFLITIYNYIYNSEDNEDFRWASERSSPLKCILIYLGSILVSDLLTQTLDNFCTRF